MEPVKNRMQTHRQKLKAAGLKPVQLWLPDPTVPGFAEECRRQSQLVSKDPQDLEDLELFSDLADWGERCNGAILSLSPSPVILESHAPLSSCKAISLPTIKA